MALLQSVQSTVKKLEAQAMAGVVAQEHLGRRAWLQVTYNSKDISEALAQYLISASYTDNLSGQVDDISLTLEDKAGLWQSDWMPVKGSTLDIILCTYNWQGLYDGEFDTTLGTFEVDEIEMTSAPDVVNIKAVAISIGDDSTLRSTMRSKTWENISVRKVANDIAWENGLKLFWDCDDNPKIDKLEQNDESDLSVLQKVCDDAGFALKITTDTIIVFDEAKYEQAEPVIEIYHPGTTNVMDVAEADGTPTPERIFHSTGYSFKTKIRDVYKKCHIKYTNDQDKSVIESTFTDSNKSNGATLEIHQQVTSQAEADRLAKKKLREKNRDECTGSYSLDGCQFLCAGETIEMIGFGVFSGRYIVTQAKHDISGSGYVTSIDVRRCLIGY
ncbi:transcriptional regulator [uncultured Megasphaera sp.]|uniref:phage late control D family protein n=1 Tax=uncultured Megasphaera sp. TaxID=165188 RepID=UPI002607C7D8|nr:transcriptional regulator [uncultured Megasphaera sp.]